MYTWALPLLLLLTQPSDVFRLQIAPLPRATVSTAQTGLVVLEGVVDPAGKVDRIQVEQGTAPFIEESLNSVRRWEFQRPDTDAAIPVSMVFLYRARTDLPDSSRVIDVPEEMTKGDRPPAVSTIVDPAYPVDSAAQGTVILQLTIDAAGHLGKTDVIADVPSLTEAARQAVSGWVFRPATRDGVPTEGMLLAVISFARPTYTY